MYFIITWRVEFMIIFLSWNLELYWMSRLWISSYKFFCILFLIVVHPKDHLHHANSPSSLLLLSFGILYRARIKDCVWVGIEVVIFWIHSGFLMVPKSAMTSETFGEKFKNTDLHTQPRYLGWFMSVGGVERW